MKRAVILLLVLLVTLTVPAGAQSSDDQYVAIYNLIQTADNLASSGAPAVALAKYLEAQTALQRLQKFNPDYSPRVVNFRLNYLAEKIAALGPKSSVTLSPPPVKPPATGPVSTPAGLNTETERQLAELREQVRSLQSDNSLLQAKLKEALATQPAAVDPRELARADQKIQSLSKENELLKASLQEQQAKSPTTLDARAVDEAKAALAEANRKLAEQTELAKNLSSGRATLQERIDALLAENRTLQNKLAAPAPTVADRSAELAAANKALAEADRQLAVRAEEAKKLAADKESLQTRINSLLTSADAAEALRAENALLKKQLAVAQAAPARGSADPERKLTEAQTRIAALQSDAELLRLEKIALQNRIRTMTNLAGRTVVQVVTNDVVRVVTNHVLTVVTNDTVRIITNTVTVATSQPADLEQIRKLERERDDLRKQLDEANAALAKRGGAALTAKVQELNNQITLLKERLEVFEARAVPYTADELALFKQPGAQLASSTAGATKKPGQGLPAGTVTLATDAQRAFAERDYARAEEKYLQILRRDENNAYTLANLGAIQLEQGKLADAEKNVLKALAAVPNDAYALSILGFLRFRQEKYDDALDALSKAVKLDPQNPEIQNYLGVTLSHKGLRGPAETALRKAIQIDPNYASAHNNLAVIYLSQDPPSVALARWHYEKAIAAGHPKNPDLEKMLEQKAKAENAP